jgi:hypothetical protein
MAQHTDKKHVTQFPSLKFRKLQYYIQNIGANIWSFSPRTSRSLSDLLACLFSLGTRSNRSKGKGGKKGKLNDKQNAQFTRPEQLDDTQLPSDSYSEIRQRQTAIGRPVSMHETQRKDLQTRRPHNSNACSRNVTGTTSGSGASWG